MHQRTKALEISKFQDGERYDVYRVTSTAGGVYYPLNENMITIKLKNNAEDSVKLDIEIFINGNKEVEITDDNPVRGGAIALETCNSIAEFDNIKVTSLNDKKNVLFEEKFNSYPDYVFPEPQEEKDILYDANGNMVKLYNKTIKYDYDNRPEKIVTEITEKNKITTTFEYDYTGQRVFKKVKQEKQTEETHYVGNLYEVQLSSRTVTGTKYIYANGQRVASVEKEDSERKVRYYHTDHLGGSNVITDESGIKVQLVEYLPFGEAKLNDKTGDFDTPYKFTGKELDSSSGLYYYGARYYSPELGRFISPDTQITDPFNPQDLNRYAYCINNPLRYVDPLGDSWFSENFEENKWFRIAVMTIGSAALGGIGGAWLAPALSKIGTVLVIQGVTISSTAGAVAGAIAGGTGGLITESYMEFGSTPGNGDGQDKLRLANGLAGFMTPLDKGNGDVSEGNSNEIFTNGVITTKEQAISYAGSSSSVYNSTRGLIYDIIESGVMKLTKGTWDKATRVLADEIIRRYQSLGPGESLIIRVHSQGAIIASNALYIAQSRIEDKSRVQVKTYGGASWTFPKGFDVKNEVNKFDPVGNLLGRGGSPLLGFILNFSQHSFDSYRNGW